MIMLNNENLLFVTLQGALQVLILVRLIWMTLTRWVLWSLRAASSL